MAYRKKFKKYGRKKMAKKSFRKWSRKRQIRKNSNRVLSKFRVVHNVAVSAGSSSGCISLSNLFWYSNDTYDNSSSASSEYTSFSNLYDGVRPCGVSIKWIPTGNVSVYEGTTTSEYYPLYTCVDYNSFIGDGITTLSQSQILEYNNMKFVNAYRPKKWYYKLKKMPQEPIKIPSQNVSTANRPQVKFGYFAVDSLSANTNLTVQPNKAKFFYNIDTAGTTPIRIGYFMITYYYAFINRR